MLFRSECGYSVAERKLSSSEKEEREDIVKGMKKNKGDFEKRYGKRGEEVMYATATKMAKERGPGNPDRKKKEKTEESGTVAGGMAPVQGSLEEENYTELHPETLELIDQYIAQFEPDADRDEIIQSVLRGSIHPSELEYALSGSLREQAKQDPINYNAAITGSYYESEDPLARLKTLAMPR